MNAWGIVANAVGDRAPDGTKWWIVMDNAGNAYERNLMLNNASRREERWIAATRMTNWRPSFVPPQMRDRVRTWPTKDAAQGVVNEMLRCIELDRTRA